MTVSDAGHKFGAYGLYVGGSLAYDDWASQILIFRDTLTRDFGATACSRRGSGSDSRR